MKRIYIVGAGGQAKETYQIYKDNRKANLVAGFIVTTPDFKEKKLRGKKVFSSEVLGKIAKESLLISAVGNSYKRKKLIKELGNYPIKYATALHSSVIFGDNIKLGEGTAVCAGSIFTCDIDIGNHALINIGCTVSHDVKLDDFVTLAPGVSIGGRVTVGEVSWIGIGTTIIQDVKVGKNCFVGAGSVVVDDIPNHSLVYGVPAKVVRKIKSNDWNKMI